MDIRLDAEVFREATTQAILNCLTTDAKSAIIAQAIEAILKPSTNSWEKGRSPIEKAFVVAVEDIAQAEARRIVAENETIRTRLHELLRSAADKLINQDTDKLAEAMATAFANSCRRD